MRNEYRVTDPGLTVAVSEANAELLPMDEVATRRILCWLTCAPNGVQAMSMDIPGLVQTSLNLGILQTHADKVTTSFSVRSSVDSQKRMLHDRIRCLVEELGGSMEIFGDYPGWEYRPESPLRDRMQEVFVEQYGYEPKVEAIHAGLECGLLSAKLPGLDCVSVGPNLKEIHTPRERLEIDSVQRLWAFVVEVLRRSR
jgi:dipeptidase D